MNKSRAGTVRVHFAGRRVGSACQSAKMQQNPVNALYVIAGKGRKTKKRQKLFPHPIRPDDCGLASMLVLPASSSLNTHTNLLESWPSPTRTIHNPPPTHQILASPALRAARLCQTILNLRSYLHKAFSITVQLKAHLDKNTFHRPPTKKRKQTLGSQAISSAVPLISPPKWRSEPA